MNNQIDPYTKQSTLQEPSDLDQLTDSNTEITFKDQYQTSDEKNTLDNIITEDNSSDQSNDSNTEITFEDEYQGLDTESTLDNITPQDNSSDPVTITNENSEYISVKDNTLTEGTNITELTNDLHDIFHIVETSIAVNNNISSTLNTSFEKLTNSDIEMLDINTGSINIYGRYGSGDVSITIKYSIPNHNIEISAKDYSQIYHQSFYNHHAVFDFSTEDIQNMHSFTENHETFSEAMNYLKDELYDFTLWNISADFNGSHDHIGFNIGTTSDYINHNEVY